MCMVMVKKCWFFVFLLFQFVCPFKSGRRAQKPNIFVTIAWVLAGKTHLKLVQVAWNSLFLLIELDLWFSLENLNWNSLNKYKIDHINRQRRFECRFIFFSAEFDFYSSQNFEIEDEFEWLSLRRRLLLWKWNAFITNHRWFFSFFILSHLIWVDYDTKTVVDWQAERCISTVDLLFIFVVCVFFSSSLSLSLSLGSLEMQNHTVYSLSRSLLPKAAAHRQLFFTPFCFSSAEIHFFELFSL